MDITQNNANCVCGRLYKHTDTISAKYLCELKPWQAITTPPIMKRLVAPGYRPNPSVA